MNQISIVDRDSAIAAIEKLGEDDLRFLNRLIVQRIGHLVHQKRAMAMGQFYVGDSVRFKSDLGEEQFGIVIRVNQKTLSINTNKDGSKGYWKVSPVFVELVQR